MTAKKTTPKAATEKPAEPAEEQQAEEQQAEEQPAEDAEEREGYKLTITDEISYHDVVSKYNLPINGYELGGLNGVIDSRYDLTEGQVIHLPWPVPEPTA